MPFVSIPIKADDDILTAAYLNTLSDDIEFLHGIGSGGNPPFASSRGTDTKYDRSDAEWYFRHRNQYVHGKVLSYGGSWEYARFYYAGFKVAGDEAAHTTFAFDVDLQDPTTWPNYVGAWATSTAYEDDVNGDGVGGNSDDGSYVSHGGSYWRCILAHTSSATDEPGVGVNTATYWEQVTDFSAEVGTFFVVWADVNFSGATEVGVEYIFENDAAAL